MSMIENLSKGVGTNALIGIGVVLALPVLLPIVGAVVRPVAKEAIKGYLTAKDKINEFTAETTEKVGDVIAEAQAEHAAAAAAGAMVVESISTEASSSTEETKEKKSTSKRSQSDK